MLLHTLGMVGGAATGVICYAMLLIIRVQPWWHAQYFIPTLGMLLGNCISGVSVGLSAIMEELTTGQLNPAILCFMLMGLMYKATPWLPASYVYPVWAKALPHGRGGGGGCWEPCVPGLCTRSSSKNGITLRVRGIVRCVCACACLSMALEVPGNMALQKIAMQQAHSS